MSERCRQEGGVCMGRARVVGRKKEGMDGGREGMSESHLASLFSRLPPVLQLQIQPAGRKVKVIKSVK